MSVETLPEVEEKDFSSFSLDELERYIAEVLHESKSPDSKLKALKEALGVWKLREASGSLKEELNTPPEWFTPELVAHTTQYLKETFGKGGLVDVEAEGISGLSIDISEEDQ